LKIVGSEVSEVERGLVAGELACPGCAGRLRPWGQRDGGSCAVVCLVGQDVVEQKLRMVVDGVSAISKEVDEVVEVFCGPHPVVEALQADHRDSARNRCSSRAFVLEGHLAGRGIVARL
jgi:hypothetical protein